MALLLSAGMAYVIGSLPFGFWLAKARGIDIQKVGSGNIGATNVLRALGPRAAVPVLIMDILKGFVGAALAAQISRATGGNPSLAAVIGGLAAFAGHNWSFLLGFRGGRGVATGAGAALYVLPYGVLLGVTVLVAVVFVTRYVSLGSILAAASVAAYALAVPFPPERRIFALAAASVIIYKHRPNIGRLLSGTESKFGQRIGSAKTPPAGDGHV
ncbi:MAG: glycerol-3-phosphate 1-O-acyltransferase PlsY [Bacillota bacterium]|nr:glycerol-3-phosphate 1-O-acyltransferase PlsY [Bacillota bacterium]